ncbi:MAG: hypothetical protein RLY47_140 [Candidatus Parcubacteria bacterium]|jgi:GrpB-like predicted nucleotidyltransferase (UPF0157 family)
MPSKLAPVILSEYQPSWAALYEKEKEAILLVLTPCILEIEHIGSTAISGALAKPEIDIMVLVKSFGDESSFIPAFEALGYVYFKRFEEMVPERRYFRKSDGIVPLVHVHVVETKGEFWNDRIDFKRYMLEHPESVSLYNETKKRLAEEFKENRKEYSAQKDIIVQEILRLAREGRAS